MAIKYRNAFLISSFLSLSICASGYAGIAKEKHIPQDVSVESKPQKSAHTEVKLDSKYKSFTGKILGNGVRMRLQPDAESYVVQELSKGDLLVVKGEKNNFYITSPPEDIRAFIFRSFVLDNIVEGSRVNIRLAPELNAPVIGYLNTGDKVNGTISEKNHKWLEIAVPQNVHFFIAKEYVDKIGGPEVKGLHEEKRKNVVQLMDAAELLAQSEMNKPFSEINFERVSESFKTIMHDYTDFPKYAEDARHRLIELQESYLEKKLVYLESRASMMSREMVLQNEIPMTAVDNEQSLSTQDRMKLWETAEEGFFATWSQGHFQKTMGDYYEDQKVKSVRISGIVEPYNDLVKNKPGNYVIRDRDMPKAYLYSTFVNLQNYVGNYVTLIVSPRPNNNFAFPAYFVLEVE